MAVFKPGQNNDDCLTYNSIINLNAFYLGNIGYSCDSGVRFSNVTIPKGATILSAKVTFQSAGNYATTVCNDRIKGEDVDDPAVFSTYANYAGRARTDHLVDWNAVPAMATDTDYDSPDLTDIIQHIVNRAGWASGQHLVLFFADNVSDIAYRILKDYDVSTTLCARLTVTWSWTPTSPLTIQPADADAYLFQQTPDTNYGTNAEIAVLDYNTLMSHSLLRFDFSTLPVGAIITAAELDLYYYMLEAGDPVGRTYWAHELTQPAWTELGTTWNKYDGTNAWAIAGGDYITTNGASVVMPASFGWVSWNVLNLVKHFQSVHSSIANFLIKDGTEENSQTGAGFASRNYATDYTLRPKLKITYTTGPAGIKTINGIAITSVKTINGIAIGSVKSWNGLS